MSGKYGSQVARRNQLCNVSITQSIDNGNSTLADQYHT